MDEELIEAAKNGEDWAGPFLVSLFAPRLLGLTRSLAGDLGDDACEHIAANAVERAVRKIDLFDAAKGDFAAWCRGMVRFAAADYRRYQERLSSLDASGDVAATEPEPSQPLPEVVKAALREAVAQLSDADQAIIALRDFEGLPSREIATRLGVNDAAVRQRHVRARRRLGELLRQDARITDYMRGGQA